MAIDKFEPGRVVSGVLLTYDNDAQHTIPASLRFDPTDTVVIEVTQPATGLFLTEDPNHDSVWFRGDSWTPEQCVFQSLEGNFTLSRIHRVFQSSNSMVAGARWQVGETVLALVRTSISAPATFDTFISRMDGLAEWWGARNILVHRDHDDLGRTIDMTIASSHVDSIEWTQNGATMRLELSWRSETFDSNRSWKLSQLTNLSSEFAQPQPADLHLDEHWKVKALLVILFGTPISYREHAVRSKASYFEELPTKDENGRERHYPLRPFVARRTVRDFGASTHEQRDFTRAITYLGGIGPEGLEKWGSSWDAGWERLVAPVIAVLGKEGAFVEDEILAAGIFIDAWGKKAGRAVGEELTYTLGTRPSPTFATYAYRAFDAAGGDWTLAGPSLAGLSRAVRDVYIAVKHAEKAQPEPQHMHLVSELLILSVRIVAAQRADPTGESVARFAQDQLKYELEVFRSAGLQISEAGEFIARA